MVIIIKGLGDADKMLTNIHSNLKTVPHKMTGKMARTLKKRVIQYLERGSQPQHPSHNTPVQIRRFLHLRKEGKGHKVFFDKYPTQGKAPGSKKIDLIHAVEFGTRPHMIGNIRHPGAKPKRFWRDGTEHFVGKDLPKLMEETAERIVVK